MNKELEQLEYEYEELKHDWEEMSKQTSLLNYYRDLCDKQQKVLDILRKSPFILERLAEKDNGEFAKRYDYGTITEEDKEIVEKWIVK